MHEPSERIDTKLGIRERVWFEDSDRGRQFMMRHEPLGTTQGGVLLCPSIFVDRIRTYRVEIGWARRLASAGFTVQRFDYLGTGQSDGDPRAITVASTAEDTAKAAAVLESSTDIVGLAGIRWGGLMAATVADRLGPIPLAMFDPVFDGKAFFREAFRSAAMSAMRGGGSAHQLPKATDQLASRGYADVLGFTVSQELYEQAAGRRFEDLVSVARRLLVLSFDGGKGLKGKKAAVVEGLQAAGFDVTVASQALEEAWWFIGTEPLPEREIIDTLAGWMTEAIHELSRA